MAATSRNTGAERRLPVSVRDLRLGSGLVLFTYVTLHFLNHATGLWSLDGAERVLRMAIALWHSIPGTVLLYGAAATHVALALWSLSVRRTWHMPWVDAIRIVAGLSMPLMLIGHFSETRLAYEWSGESASYGRVITNIARNGGWQFALLAPGWLHGCLGIDRAFAARSWYRRLRPALFAAALLIPTFSAMGFLSMYREARQLEALDASWLARQTPRPQAERQQAQRAARARGETGWYLLVALAIGVPFGRFLVEKQRGRLVTVRYPGRTVRVPRGWSVLDASRAHRVTHLSACGGRARCTTCRVRILAGAEHCPAPGSDEARALARVGAPPDIRLACQLRPVGDVTLVPAYRVGAGPEQRGWVGAERRALAVLTIGPRRVGEAAERLLPHDLLFLVNRLVAEAEAVIQSCGGHSLGWSADGVTGVFGLNSDLGDAARSALAAVVGLEERLVGDRAPRLSAEFGLDNRLFVTAHAGPVVLGRQRGTEEPNLMTIGGCVAQMHDWWSWLAPVADERFAISARLLQAVGWEAPQPPSVAEGMRWVAAPGGSEPPPASEPAGGSGDGAVSLWRSVADHALLAATQPAAVLSAAPR